MNNTFAAGSYTRARGRGISIYQWDDSADINSLVSEYQDIIDPSYLSWDPSSRKLYAVSEVDEDSGTVTAFLLEEDGSLSFSGQQRGPGKAACHLSFLHNPELLFAASYLDGSRLFIANQDSHNISCRKFDSENSLPREGWGEDINTGSPVCIVML